MDAMLREIADSTIGFMPREEGIALYDAALLAPSDGPFLEIGSYCGKSAIYLGAAAAASNTLLFSIDHHRGSEEQQPGQAFFDPRLWDDNSGRIDTLPIFRATIARAGLEGTVVPIVAASETVAAVWSTSLSFLFVDGGHSARAAHADHDNFARHVTPDGVMAIHDVFEDAAEGGRPPFEIFEKAMDSGAFEEVSQTGSLRVLRKTGHP